MPPSVAVLPSTTPSPQTQRKTWFERTGPQYRDHQHEDAGACNDQNEQVGVNESKTDANDQSVKDGNNED
jgi:hypothetical protein